MKKPFSQRFQFYGKTEGSVLDRYEPCRICGNETGLKIAETEFWDLQYSSIIKCQKCGLIQLDPMLNARSIQLGCDAYFHYEISQTSKHDQERNLLRNYRRGILFAYQIKQRGYNPVEILEFGPGSGYFAAGIRHVFPDAVITVVDIVDEVLAENLETHGFAGIKGSPEDLMQSGNKRFDLIIARDILEHVADIGAVIMNISNHLIEGGLFHFLTPNGHEDVWKHYVHWSIHKNPSELLINHVNYFDGEGLLGLMEQNHLAPLEYYTYQLKSTLKGKGWSVNATQAAESTSHRSASSIVSALKNKFIPKVLLKNEILNQWYLKPSPRWITFAYCWYMHQPLIKINPARNIGHEIFGLFVRKS